MRVSITLELTLIAKQGLDVENCQSQDHFLQKKKMSFLYILCLNTH